MTFADLRNDFVFWRIFANHPDLLCSLLSDLLGRGEAEAIVSVEYLPNEQLSFVVEHCILKITCVSLRLFPVT